MRKNKKANNYNEYVNSILVICKLQHEIKNIDLKGRVIIYNLVILSGCCLSFCAIGLDIVFNALIFKGISLGSLIGMGYLYKKTNDDRTKNRKEKKQLKMCKKELKELFSQHNELDLDLSNQVNNILNKYGYGYVLDNNNNSETYKYNSNDKFDTSTYESDKTNKPFSPFSPFTFNYDENLPREINNIIPDGNKNLKFTKNKDKKNS